VTISKRALKIWLIVVFIHILAFTAEFIAIDVLDIYDVRVSAFIIYVTIVIISLTGLPVFVNPNSGWGWSDPNWFGWSLGILTWIGFYFLLALLIEKLLSFKKSS